MKLISEDLLKDACLLILANKQVDYSYRILQCILNVLNVWGFGIIGDRGQTHPSDSGLITQAIAIRYYSSVLSLPSEIEP